MQERTLTIKNDTPSVINIALRYRDTVAVAQNDVEPGKEWVHSTSLAYISYTNVDIRVPRGDESRFFVGQLGPGRFGGGANAYLYGTGSVVIGAATGIASWLRFIPEKISTQGFDYAGELMKTACKSECVPWDCSYIRAKRRHSSGGADYGRQTDYLVRFPYDVNEQHVVVIRVNNNGKVEAYDVKSNVVMVVGKRYVC
jgi:hypothetical protein